MDKNYRIHTNIASDTILNINMTQDYDFLEVLSLKLRQKDAYKLHSSNYGVIIGRVLANDAFGIPNAKISVFIEKDENDANYLETIYPYKEITSKDKDGRRYNLLPDYSDDECYRIVGTFPNKRLVLDENSYLEVYDKYWKYSTVSNNAGDYMIFGLPSGNQQIHVDIDLSDIGILSQKPRDFEYKGYNVTMFDNPNQFKESTNLDNLAQIFSQNKSVFVYPFWGDADNGVAAITRTDIQIQYKFEPTCVFMGSIISDNEGNSIGHKCAPEVNNGMNDQLIAGEGTIEMIRKTTDGLVEEYQIQGNQLINENGVWCYQIPMNLDYVGTDEYGNIVPTDNPNKGIPTRTQVRFRFSKTETSDEGFSRHTAKYLVPMNPIFVETRDECRVNGRRQNGVVPIVKESGQEVEKMYTFGSSTPDSCFRDLYWNNVYSVKNYIPKVQVAHRPYSKNYGALKGSNLADDQNPIPFNKLRVDIPFMYMIVCILFTVVMWIVTIVNTIICIIDKILAIFNKIHNLRIPVIKVKPFKWIPAIPYIGCISLGGGLTEDNTAFYPGCDCKEGLNAADCPEDMEGNCKKRASKGELMDRVQRRLAEDYKIIKLDLYQDWLNGSLYMPLWYWRKRKKKTFLFFTLSRAKNEYCSCDKHYSRLKTYTTCNVVYKNDSLSLDDNRIPEKENSWHRSKARSQQVRYENGLIKEVENKDGLKVYYYTALQATTDNMDSSLAMDKRTTPFFAIRLYATDIILLGNLNESNLYGIPQFFKALPSTTANIPPIATIEESAEEDEDVKKYSENEVGGSEDSGTSITTGMDWGRSGESDTPQYKKGLFMDLACTYAHTKAKSCFNVERLSELGVNLDMTYNMSYSHRGNDIETGLIDSDGFITKYELDDMENRAMFATMNHIGFIPQSYQDTISGYTTQVEDKNTGYLIPKFKYIYPVDFDGRMQLLMDRYKNGFSQATFDDTDESYLTFRFGAESSSNQNLEHRRIRHFYRNPNNTAYEMPVYNNSYYFYFGIKKGSTAIDKFNELFYSECYQNSKKPFTLNIEKLGKSYCPSLYDCRRNQVFDENTQTWVNAPTGTQPNDRGYGYIRVSSDDIKVPFSYVLYDSNDVEVVSENDMYNTDFVIGGYIDEETNNVIHNEEGKVRYQNTNEVVPNGYGQNGLTNQTYTLLIRDSNGRTITERVKLEMDKIAFEYVGQKLGTKFYNTEVSRIDYICNDENQFYGILSITKFYIDTYEYEITSAICTTANSEKYTVSVSGTPVNADAPICSGNVVFELYVLNQDSNGEQGNAPSVRDCMCDLNNSIPYRQNMKINNVDLQYYFKFEDSKFMFYVYQPSSFVGKIIQVCKGKLLEENSTTEIIRILNGENFNTYLNTMPIRFMIGTTSDGLDSYNNVVVGNTSKFYASEYGTMTIGTMTTDGKPSITSDYDEIGKGLSGWVGTHQETSYQFNLPINVTIQRNRDIWSDYLTIGTDITNISTRKNILRYKLDKMFKVSDAAYLTSSNNQTFKYTATGGVEPILYRTVAPYYSNYNMMLTNFLYNDTNSTTAVVEFPQIVGSNYHSGGRNCWEIIDGDTGSPRLNDLYSGDENRKYLGNYFAAFTKNGRYISSTSGDCSTSIMALPNYAPVNLRDDWKRIGQDVKISNIGDISKVYKKGTNDGECRPRTVTQPYLRTLFVDRRLDFDYVFWGPTTGSEFRLSIDKNRERVWKSARISGITYGGIEMSYDEEYNIVSADSSSNDCYYISEIGDEPIFNSRNDALAYAKEYFPSKDESELEKYIEKTRTESNASGNTRLEYSYYVTSAANENAYTIYNIPTDCIWVRRPESDTNMKIYDVGNKDSEDSVSQYVKTLYSFDINTLDVRELYWSTFNKKRLNKYGKWQPFGTDGILAENKNAKEFYVYSHYNDDDKYYNDDFNREKITEKPNTNYPSRRLIDIGNIPQSKEYLISMTSCGYGMNPEVDDDGLIKSYVEAGDNTEITLEFNNPIEFIPPNADSKDYGNMIFKQLIGTTNDGFTKFDSQKVKITFRYTKVSSNDFDVYTRVPGIIKVLSSLFNESGGKHTDGISYIKTTSKHDKIFGNNEEDVDVRIGETILHVFNKTSVNKWSAKYFGMTQDIFVPQGIVLDGNSGFFYRDSTTPPYDYLLSDENDFYNIQFVKEDLDLDKNKNDDVYVFAILVDRIYKGNDYDNLTRRIRTFETSSLYDCRHLLIKVLNGPKYTYITCNKSDITTSYHGEGEITGETASTYISIDGTATTEIQDVYQVITFQMKFINNGAPINMSNQAFADYNLMGFTFKFVNSEGEPFYLSPEVKIDESLTTTDEIVYVNFRIVFTQEMGVLADDRWKDGAKVTILAKNHDNFIYKVCKDYNENPFELTKATNANYDKKSREITNGGTKDETLVSIKELSPQA